ncbi:hypothetical protein E2320_005188 [Naja naja]|nr:hypothetical protein E2320_005188 [Naja naja]
MPQSHHALPTAMPSGEEAKRRAIEEAQATELSNLSAAEIQKASSLPGGKPSSAVHYEDTYFEDEDFDEEEAIHQLRTPQPTQKEVFPLTEDN